MKYYGYYSRVSRRKCQKEGLDDAITCIIETRGNKRFSPKNRARLIMQIIRLRFLKRTAIEPPSLPNGIAKPCFQV